MCGAAGRGKSLLVLLKVIDILKSTGSHTTVCKTFPPPSNSTGIFFMTPEQKALLQNVPQVIVSGAAGHGKSLLHHLKMEEFLKSTGSHTTVCKTFPPSSNSTSIEALHAVLKNTAEIISLI